MRGDGGALGVQAGADVADRGGEARPEGGGAVDVVGWRGTGIRAAVPQRSHTRKAASAAPTRAEA